MELSRFRPFGKRKKTYFYGVAGFVLAAHVVVGAMIHMTPPELTEGDGEPSLREINIVEIGPIPTAQAVIMVQDDSAIDEIPQEVFAPTFDGESVSPIQEPIGPTEATLPPFVVEEGVTEPIEKKDPVEPVEPVKDPEPKPPVEEQSKPVVAEKKDPPKTATTNPKTTKPKNTKPKQTTAAKRSTSPKPKSNPAPKPPTVVKEQPRPEPEPQRAVPVATPQGRQGLLDKIRRKKEGTARQAPRGEGRALRSGCVETAPPQLLPLRTAQEGHRRHGARAGLDRH